MRFMLKSKIHQATLTGARIDYEGSLTLDPHLLEEAGMIPGEQAHVFNIDNGERLITYIIAGATGMREVVLNGAAARKGAVGDRIIIATFDLLDEQTAREHTPRILCLDDENRVIRSSGPTET